MYVLEQLSENCWKARVANENVRINNEPLTLVVDDEVCDYGFTPTDAIASLEKRVAAEKK